MTCRAPSGGTTTGLWPPGRPSGTLAGCSSRRVGRFARTAPPTAHGCGSTSCRHPSQAAPCSMAIDSSSGWMTRRSCASISRSPNRCGARRRGVRAGPMVAGERAPLRWRPGRQRPHAQRSARRVAVGLPRPRQHDRCARRRRDSPLHRADRQHRAGARRRERHAALAATPEREAHSGACCWFQIS